MFRTQLVGRIPAIAAVGACSLVAWMPGVASAAASPDPSGGGTISVSGTIGFSAPATGPAVREVVFSIDGHLAWVTRRRPFRFRADDELNTRRVRNGAHTLGVDVYFWNGHVRAYQRRIIVRNRRHGHRRFGPQANGASAPPGRGPAREPRPAIVAAGSPANAVPGPSIVAFNRETYQYSSTLPISQEAGHYQLMVLQATDGPLVRALHAANPNLKIFVYQHPWASKPGDPAAWSVCTSYPQDMANHPDWFLRNSLGQPITTVNWGNYSMDIGNQAYQQSCIANAIKLAKQYGFDGVYLDDITASPTWDIPAGVTIPKYPTPASWQAATTSFVNAAASAFHANGLKVVANLCGTQITPGLWQQWSAPLDGSEDEYFTSGHKGVDPSLWPEQLADLAWSQANGKLAILHSWNTTATGNTFGLASMLLATNGTASYSTANGGYTSSEAFYPAYSTAQQLGAPMGSDFRLANGLYERVFASGIVLVNPSGRSVSSLSLGGGTYSGTGLTNVTSVSVAPSSALILLRVG